MGILYTDAVSDGISAVMTTASVIVLSSSLLLFCIICSSVLFIKDCSSNLRMHTQDHPTRFYDPFIRFLRNTLHLEHYQKITHADATVITFHILCKYFSTTGSLNKTIKEDCVINYWQFSMIDYQLLKWVSLISISYCRKRIVVFASWHIMVILFGIRSQAPQPKAPQTLAP